MQMAKYDNPNDIQNLTKNTMNNLNQIMRLAALNLFRQVVQKTPVDTGRARGNWQVSVGGAAKGIVEGEKSEEQVLQEIIEVIYEARIKQGFFLTNNLPYIQKLEYGGYPNPAKTGEKLIAGFSKQAPAGMVRISMAQIEKDLNEIIEDVISKRRGAIKQGKERLI